jgi:hypothetical protein
VAASVTVFQVLRPMNRFSWFHSTLLLNGT